MAEPSLALDIHPAASTGDFLTRAEVARITRLSRQTVRQLAIAGDLEEVMVAPRSPRITAASLRRHLERHRTVNSGAA